MSVWANRKAAVQAEAEALESAEHEAVVAEQHAVLAEKPEAEVLAELELPNPDDMQAGDDFSAFMKETVPAALRNRALRTLWRSDPVLANVDMLVDYGDDFTGKNDPVRIIKTIYRVGKGMLPDKEDIEDEEVEAAEDAVDDVVEVAEFETAKSAPLPAPEAPAAPLPPRRRMRFEFEASETPASTETETV
ncbi:MAG: DUF3306 domain-containing protein [Rhodobacteraceae bacterium]|nr:DUF3306 domain-containing protein [Paracoccaceae bacterium]